jgi:hypothetical protein
MPGSHLTYGLISRPYCDGPALERLPGANPGRDVSALWLLPITKSERDFKKEFGVERLEALFDQAGLQYANPQRPSVV